MDGIGHLRFWAEFPQYVLFSLRFLENKQGTAYNILREIKPVTKVFNWNSLVKQAGDRYI